MTMVWTIYLDSQRGPTFTALEEALEQIKEDLDGAEAGTSMEIRCEEMTDSALVAMQYGPEWGGW